MRANFARVLILCGLPLAVLCLAGPALAHKVSVFAYVENGQLKGEGYFAGGDKAQNCPVEVQDAQGQTVGQAQTNAQGEFSLPLPASAPPLKIILRAGQGHQGDYTLTAADLGAAADSPAPSPASAQAAPAAEAAPAAAAPGLSAAELEQIVAQALDKRLAPLTAQVAKLAAERAVSLQDVVGGLGYILGLLGIAAYVKSRQGGAPPRA
jgi:nickel transport protein